MQKTMVFEGRFRKHAVFSIGTRTPSPRAGSADRECMDQQSVISVVASAASVCFCAADSSSNLWFYHCPCRLLCLWFKFVLLSALRVSLMHQMNHLQHRLFSRVWNSRLSKKKTFSVNIQRLWPQCFASWAVGVWVSVLCFHIGSHASVQCIAHAGTWCAAAQVLLL